MRLFDSHSHLNFSSFQDDYQDIIADCLPKDIGIINIGSQIDTSRRAVEIANQYPDAPIYASIGLHPIHLSQTEVDPEESDLRSDNGASEEEIKFKSREEKFNQTEYQKMIDNDKNNPVKPCHGARKIVAIGETGFDFWHVPENMTLDEIKEKQIAGFKQQLEFASQNNLPVILHARGSKNNPEDAYEDILKILASRDAPWRVSTDTHSVPGVIHCFGSTLEIAQEFLNLGFYISFTGIITFKNKSIDELRGVVKFVPLEKILVETDAPYLAPEPYRGQKNTPQFVEYVARKVAEIKDVSFEEVARVTTENVKKLLKV